MKDLNIMALDLEYNQPSQLIIQVGIVVGNLLTGEILGKYCWNIHQEEKIAEYITKLTGITQKDVDEGCQLSTVYSSIVEIFKEHSCFRNPITWGAGDSEDLRKVLNLDNERFLFGRRWIDAKTLFVSHCFANDLKHQSGLSKSLNRLGLKFEGKKHNAMWDALNTFHIYRYLLNYMGNDLIMD